MADVQITCSQCGAQTVLSEFVAEEARRCRQCGAALSLPQKGDAGLRLRPVPAPEPRPAPSPQAETTQSVLAAVHKARSRIRRRRAWVFWLAFAVSVGLLLGSQYWVSRGSAPEWLDRGYEVGRNVVAGLALFGVVAVAFRESTLQGLLCLLLPPYALYYAATRLEYDTLRGLFLAVCLMIGLEVRLLPERALLSWAQQRFDQFTASVSQAIERAGRPPDLPQADRPRRGRRR